MVSAAFYDVLRHYHLTIAKELGGADNDRDLSPRSRQIGISTHEVCTTFSGKVPDYYYFGRNTPHLPLLYCMNEKEGLITTGTRLEDSVCTQKDTLIPTP